MKKILVLIAVILLAGCHEKRRYLHVFIPQGYLGDVGLYFGVDSSKNHMINSKDDMYVIFLSGNNLDKFTIKEENFPGGPYQMYYYYYSKDTLYQLNSPVTGYDIKSDYSVGLMGTSGNYGSIKHFRVNKANKD